MSKKKKEIIDGKLELLTPEVIERLVKESRKATKEEYNEFFEKARNKPIKNMISDLKNTIHILMSLIKDIDPEAYHKYAINKSDYYEGLFNLRKEVSDEYKQAYIKDLLKDIENIDIVRMHLVRLKE